MFGHYNASGGTFMRVLVTGATGFVGRRLLEKLDRPVVLSRDAAKAEKSLAKFSPKCFTWDAETEPAPAAAFEGVEAVVHLAGEPIAEGRWTAAKKKRLRESRVAGTRHLVQTMKGLATRPKVFVSASAVGYYGDRGDELLTEDVDPASDFLAELCVAWERESHPASDLGIRVVNPRIGIVLGEKGGALPKMLTPFKMGVGSPLGSGKQFMPWIHLDDLVGLILFALDHDNLRGPTNAAAPHPATNYEFTKTLGKVLHRPTFFPAVPKFMLPIMFGEFGQVLLFSQRVVPQAAKEAGYEFKYPELEGALRHILDKQ
jgi:uncharacterized protein (TIGR01777 family)